MKRVYRFAILWFTLGMCYAQLELFVRGVTYLPMTFIGGLAGVLIGLLNRHPAYYNRTMWQQCYLGTLIVLAVEFATGFVCNLLLRMNLWDYSGLPCNLMGQICLRMAFAWFFLMPFALWVDDFLRWKFFDEKKPRSPFYNYKRLFTFR